MSWLLCRIWPFYRRYQEKLGTAGALPRGMMWSVTDPRQQVFGKRCLLQISILAENPMNWILLLSHQATNIASATAN